MEFSLFPNPKSLFKGVKRKFKFNLGMDFTFNRATLLVGTKGNVKIKEKINLVNEKSKISQMKGILYLTVTQTLR